jgi:hypothetical protein
MQEKLILSGGMRSEKPDRCRAIGLLSKESLQTTMTPSHLDSLLDGRPSSILFKQPFDNHGVVRLISEQQPPLFLLAEWNEMIHRMRVSAAGSLDAVVHG